MKVLKQLSLVYKVNFRKIKHFLPPKVHKSAVGNRLLVLLRIGNCIVHSGFRGLRHIYSRNKAQ